MIDLSGSGASGETSSDSDESEESGESGTSGESGEGGISKRSEIPSEERKEGKNEPALSAFFTKFFYENVNYDQLGFYVSMNFLRLHDEKRSICLVYNREMK